MPARHHAHHQGVPEVAALTREGAAKDRLRAAAALYDVATSSALHLIGTEARRLAALTLGGVVLEAPCEERLVDLLDKALRVFAGLDLEARAVLGSVVVFARDGGRPSSPHHDELVHAVRELLEGGSL